MTTFLSGWKTYIVAGACIVLAGLEAFGVSIPGLTSSPTDLIIAALGMFGLRSAIAAK